MYKVFLHNDTYNKREYVVKVLLKVIDTMTVDDAVVVMQVGAGGWWWGGASGMEGRSWLCVVER